MTRGSALARLPGIALALIVTATTSYPSPDDQEFTAQVLNVSPNKIDGGALQAACAAIVRLWKENKLQPTRVMIFADHPIVKEAQADQTIRIAVSSPRPAVILIPRSHHGSRIVVQQSAASGDTYALYSAPADERLQIDACFKP